MPFQSKRAKLILSEEEIDKLEEITRSRTAPVCHVDRAKMLLEYHEGKTISAIARQLKTYRDKVSHQVDKALQIGAITSLDDLPRPGRNKTITDDAMAWLISLACSKPQDHGYAHELWTQTLLAKHAREHCKQAGHDCLSKLSKGTVSKILSANALSTAYRCR